MTELLYQGHGSYRLTSEHGAVVYIDPFAGEGYDKPADLVLVSHEHSDHISGLDVISARYRLPVYASRGTMEALLEKGFFQRGQELHILDGPAEGAHGELLNLRKGGSGPLPLVDPAGVAGLDLAAGGPAADFAGDSGVGVLGA